MTSPRVALLVDGDNLSPIHATRLIEEAKRLGRPDIARAYFANPASPWASTPGLRPIHSGGGKNATDLLLSIDAMDLAHSHGIETFVIASSDGDFAHIAMRLRETGRHILGVGESKTPPCFRAACSEFRQIETPAPPPMTVKPDHPAPAKPEPAPTQSVAVSPKVPASAQPQGRSRPSDLDQQIRAAINAHAKDGKGMLVTTLNVELSRNHGFQISTLPEKTWRAYLAARPTLFALDPKGPEAMVRFLPKGFTA